MSDLVKLSKAPLDVEYCRKLIEDPSAGAQTVFCGAVRNHTKTEKVSRLTYEAYEPMAIRELEFILDRTHNRWPIVKACVHHRLGTLQIGELAVVVAVSSAHRQTAFEACMYIIDELKRDVPIWKREYLESGAKWISDRP